MGEKKHETVANKNESRSSRYILPLAMALALVVIANVFVVSQSNSAIDEKVKNSEAQSLPAALQITEITAKCDGCFDISAVVAAIKQLKATVTENELESTSSEAKELIAKYNITRLPTLIITGDTEKAGLGATVWSSVGTVEPDGALVMRGGAPFVELPAGVVRGKTDVIFLNYPACTGCYNVTVHKSVLNRFGLVTSGEKTVDAGSAEGKALLGKYNITRVPTVLISPDAKYYDALQGIWAQVGTIEKDGWYVFRSMEAMQGVTYYDLAQSKAINQTI